MLDSPVLPMIALFLSTAVVLVLRGPLGKALAERISGRVGSGDAVHERLDFAERLLARQPGGQMVGPGGT